MPHQAQKNRGVGTPVVVGTGLVALDAVVSADSEIPVRYWAGGTCANVLIAMRYLGWNSQPIARLAEGNATDLLMADMRRWKLSDRFIRVEPDGSTPVIFEYISRDAHGHARHSFSWRCDACGARFPGYKPELLTVAEEIVPKLSATQVFFFDRVSPSALILARAAANAGALVVFEPSGMGNPIHFQQAWQLAHVVKYSHERLSEFPEIGAESVPHLVIETLGEGGLRYRWRKSGERFGAWTKRKALPVDNIKDTAGSGDWCTAGILCKLGTKGLSGLRAAHRDEIVDAVEFGQALAAWNCRFEGARGGMYAVTKRAFGRQVREILMGSRSVVPMKSEQITDSLPKNAFCRVCEHTSRRNRRTSSRP